MSPGGWRLGYLAREVNRTLFNPRSRSSALLFLAVALGVGAVALPAVESQGFRSQLAEQQAAGRNIVVFGSRDTQHPVAIDRASCDSLTAVPGVPRSGLTELEGMDDFVQLGPNVSVLGSTSSLFPDLRDGVLLVGSALHPPVAAEFTLVAANGPLYRARVNRVEPTGLNSNSAVVVPLAPDIRSASSCIAVLDAYSNANQLLPVLRARLHTSGGDMVASLASNPTIDPVTVFLNRPGQYVALLLGLLGGLATGMITRSRSSEFAAYRMSGTTPPAAALLLAMQHLQIAALFAASSCAAVIVLRGALAAPLSAALSCLAGAATWLLAALVVTVDLPLRNVLALAKDR